MGVDGSRSRERITADIAHFLGVLGHEIGDGLT